MEDDLAASRPEQAAPAEQLQASAVATTQQEQAMPAEESASQQVPAVQQEQADSAAEQPSPAEESAVPPADGGVAPVEAAGETAEVPDDAASCGVPPAPDAAMAPVDFTGMTAVATLNGPRPSLQDVGAAPLFEKVLTACDAASKGRIVLPKKAAVEHFDSADGKDGVAVDCEDTFGNSHALQHRFWTNVKSRMYLLEGLESVFRTYRIVAGDVLCFGRQEDGKMVVSARKPGPDDVPRTRRSAGVADRPSKMQRAETRKSARRQGRPLKAQLQQQDSVDGEEGEEAMYFLPPADGVFRAVRPGASASPPSAQVMDHGACWSATIEVEGEMYQAFFESLEAAQEAFEVLWQQEQQPVLPPAAVEEVRPEPTAEVAVAAA